MKKKRLKISPKALVDLEGIYKYSYDNFGQKIAVQYMTDIDESFEKIAENPNLGCDYREVFSNGRVVLVASHLVFYKVMETTVAVVRVLHKSMDHKRHLN